MSRICAMNLWKRLSLLAVLFVAGQCNSANAGVIASLGPLTKSGTTLSADISLDFTSDLTNSLLQLVSFDFVKSESSLGTISNFSGFTFTPTGNFADASIWIDFSFLLSPSRIEFFNLHGGETIAGQLVLGTVAFDYSTLGSSFGMPGDFVTIDITGTTEFLDPDGAGPEPEGDQPTSSVIFNTNPGTSVIPVAYESYVPGSRTFKFSGSGNDPVPEPTSIASFLLLAIGITRLRARR
jgi:hypothetical protein